MLDRKDFKSPVGFDTTEGYRFITTILEQTNSLIENALEMELRSCNLSVAQFRILSLLASVGEEGSTIEGMSVLMIRKLNTISTMVNNMEKQGLVRRVKRGRKQKSRIYITAQGRDLFEQQLHTDALETILSVLSEKEQEDFLYLLFKIRDSAEESLGLKFKPIFLHDE